MVFLKICCLIHWNYSFASLGVKIELVENFAVRFGISQLFLVGQGNWLSVILNKYVPGFLFIDESLDFNLELMLTS